MGLRRGAARWGAGAQQCGAAQGRSSVGLRRGAAPGRAWARHVAVEGCSSVGLRRGASWGCAWAQCGAAYGRGMGP